MELKRVSFKVAKALKEAGYPQGNKNSGDCDVYPLEDHDDNYTSYTRIGKITTRYKCETWRILSSIPYVVAPTYIDVWLWLWREKEIYIELNNGAVVSIQGIDPIWHIVYQNNYFDPEEAIKAAVEYIVDNDLIK